MFLNNCNVKSNKTIKHSKVEIFVFATNRLGPLFYDRNQAEK